MKIGLLAYHAAPNYGAFLQLLSTVEFIKKTGNEPIVINWIPKDTQAYFEKVSSYEVRVVFEANRNCYYPMSQLCRTDKEVALVIDSMGIDAVIIGSDAILQHHSILERIFFIRKCIPMINHVTSDHLYPNSFWGCFNRYTKKKVPVAVISGSSQDCKYGYIKGWKKYHLNKTIHEFSYISVRDTWTQGMIKYLTKDSIIPDVTPDPVFAFNENAGTLLPSKEEILSKYCLPNNYIIVSFKGTQSVNQEWITTFEKIAAGHHYGCFRLPYADGNVFGEMKYKYKDPVPPLDWFALIKYSNGYIGNNMHPVVVAIHNCVPFFSFDNYGIPIIEGRHTNGESSKIYDLLNKAEMLNNRVFTKGINYKAPSPENVFHSLISFDKYKIKLFRDDFYKKYVCMMEDVMESILIDNK